MRRNPDEEIQKLRREVIKGDNRAALRLMALLDASGEIAHPEFPEYHLQINKISASTLRLFHTDEEEKNNLDDVLKIRIYHIGDSSNPIDTVNVLIDSPVEIRTANNNIAEITFDFEMQKLPLAVIDNPINTDITKLDPNDPRSRLAWIPYYRSSSNPNYYGSTFQIRDAFPNGGNLPVSWEHRDEFLAYLDFLITTWLAENPDKVFINNKIWRKMVICNSYEKYKMDLTTFLNNEQEFLSRVQAWVKLDLK